ncbi:MAG: biotin/lipoyl-binding protein [Bacillota bacterium]|nr:biotin/lipoyl-binding protein [Bacillota bacterium]
MSQINMLRRRRAIRRGLILLLILCLAVAAVVYIYASRDKAPGVRTAILEDGDITSYMYLTVQIKPGAVQENYVGRQLVTAVHVKPGDQVEKGDRLISFDLTELEDQLDEARKYRQEAEDALADMADTVGEQAASSQKALQDLQYQINRLSGNLSGSIAAVGSLTSLQPWLVEVDDARLSELAEQLAAVDRDAPDAESQYRDIIALYSDAVVIEQSEDYQKQLDRLQSNLSGASRSLSSLSGSITDPDLLAALGGASAISSQGNFASTAQSILAQAIQAEVMAEQALQNAVETITADFDGVIALVNATAGSYTGSAVNNGAGTSFAEGFSGSLGGLTAGQTKVIVVFDNTRPVATYQANRYDAARLSAGMPVVYRQDGSEYYGQITYKSKFAASVDPAAASADSILGGMGSVSGLTSEPTLAIEMSIKGDRLTDLVLGFNIDAEIQTAFAQNVLLLPAEAMKRELGQYYVFAVDDDNHIQRFSVIPGIQSDTHIQVLDGLSAGMRVVLSPANDLVEGMVVIIEEENAK